jgi:hypothetical protein
VHLRELDESKLLQLNGLQASIPIISSDGSPLVSATFGRRRCLRARAPRQAGKSNMPKSPNSAKRAAIRKEFWPKEDAWTGENETGWFKSPRTLPLILSLLRSKELTNAHDPTGVYLELLARHFDSGVVEVTSEEDHAFAAGYSGTRARRTWQERMKLLEDLGFIKTKKFGNKRFKQVLLVHPTAAVKRLHDKGRVREEWWNAYRTRQIEIGEPSYEERGELVVLEVLPGKKKATAAI